MCNSVLIIRYRGYVNFYDRAEKRSRTPREQNGREANIFFLNQKPGLCREETGAHSVTTGVSGASNSSKPSTTVSGPFQVLAGFISDTVLLLNPFKTFTWLIALMTLGNCN